MNNTSESFYRDIARNIPVKVAPTTRVRSNRTDTGNPIRVRVYSDANGVAAIVAFAAEVVEVTHVYALANTLVQATGDVGLAVGLELSDLGLELLIGEGPGEDVRLSIAGGSGAGSGGGEGRGNESDE